MGPTNVSAPIIKKISLIYINSHHTSFVWIFQNTRTSWGLEYGRTQVSTNAYTEEMWNLYLRNTFGLDVSQKPLLLCVKIIFISVSELHLLLIMWLLNKKIGRTSTCASTYFCNLTILFYILLYITWVSDSDIIILCIL